MAALTSYPLLTFSNPSKLNFALATKAKQAGWSVKSVPAYSEIYTFFASWPTPFVPINAFSISKTGGTSGELLTPPDFPAYSPPSGYTRTDMSDPIAAVKYIPSFLGSLLGCDVSFSQVVPLGVYGILVSWVPPHDDNEEFYEIIRPTESAFAALVAIGASLGIQITSPRYGGYILTSPLANGNSLTIWLDNNVDFQFPSVDATESKFYVTQTTLNKVPHPRSDEGLPSDASGILTLIDYRQAFDFYVNRKNFWVMANSGTAPFHWYISNLLPQGNVNSAMLLWGEALGIGPRYMNEAPVWWMNLNGTIYIRPSFTGNAQVGRLISVAGENSPLQWDDDSHAVECTEFFVFVRDSATTLAQFIGLGEDILIGHTSYLTAGTISFDGDTFYKLSTTNGAGVLVRV